ALKAKPPRLGVDLLFVDGEDYGDFYRDSADVLIGSRYFAAHQPTGYQPLFAVLFDMVADKDQQFYYEGNSQSFAPEVVERVWRTAADLGYGRVFLPGVKPTLIDDHVALQQAGIHAIDVVDFDYPYWHTREDTIDKVTAAAPGDVRLVARDTPPPGPRGLSATARTAARLARPLLPGERIDLDRADVTEITRLPRIGPAFAQRIVAWREQHGLFGGLARF